MLAYALPGPMLADFNRCYFGASLVGLCASLGFDFALARTPAPRYAALTALVFNTGLVSTGLWALSVVRTQDVVTIAALALAMAVGNTGIQYCLYADRYDAYLRLSGAKALLNVAAIAMTHYLGVKPLGPMLLAQAVVAVLAIAAYPNAPRGQRCGLGPLYTLGAASCLTTIAPAIGFQIDKYVAARVLPASEANAYTFAWTLLTPLLYLGAAAERIVYAADNRSGLRLFAGVVGVLTVTAGLYAWAVSYVVSSWKEFIPHSVASGSLKAVITPLFTGYGVFAVVNGPLNGVYMRARAQTIKRTSIAQGLAVVLLGVACAVALHRDWVRTYTNIIGGVMAYLAVLVSTKVYAICRRA